MFAAVSATASVAAATAAVAATTAVSATAVTDRRAGMATATAVTNRRLRMTAANDRCMGVNTMHDRCMGMTGMTDRCVGMIAVTAPTTGMSAMPMMPAVAAAPADAGSTVLAAPVPAWAIPPVVVPAIMVTEPDELRTLDHVQAIGRVANYCGRDHRGRVDAGAYEWYAGNECRCSRDRSRFTHDDLRAFIQIL